MTERGTEINRIINPLRTLEQKRQESSALLESNRLITDRSALVKNVHQTSEYYRYLLFCFETLKEKYNYYWLPNVLRQLKAEVVIDLPESSTHTFERLLMKKFNHWYFNHRFEFNFKTLNNDTGNQRFTLEASKRLYHLSLQIRDPEVTDEIFDEIVFFLTSFSRVLETIEEHMMCKSSKKLDINVWSNLQKNC